MRSMYVGPSIEHLLILILLILILLLLLLLLLPRLSEVSGSFSGLLATAALARSTPI